MSFLRTNTYRQLRKVGARYQSQIAKSGFESERNAVKVHAGGKVYIVELK